MKVRLEDIPPEGLEVAFDAAGNLSEEWGDAVLRVLAPPHAELFLERQEDMVQARGRYTARLELACSRCLEPMALDLAGPLRVIYQPQPQGLGGEEVELADDDLEVCFYTGEEIDLSGALHDEVSLALPMAPLCRPDCPGLCPVCGQSRREGACSCQEDKMDPRWAKLAKLKVE